MIVGPFRMRSGRWFCRAYALPLPGAIGAVRDAAAGIVLGASVLAAGCGEGAERTVVGQVTALAPMPMSLSEGFCPRSCLRGSRCFSSPLCRRRFSRARSPLSRRATGSDSVAFWGGQAPGGNRLRGRVAEAPKATMLAPARNQAGLRTPAGKTLTQRQPSRAARWASDGVATPGRCGRPAARLARSTSGSNPGATV